MRFSFILLVAGVAASLALWGTKPWRQEHGPFPEERLSQIVKIGNRPEVSCGDLAAQRPLVILALGQSNAANHGELGAGGSTATAVFAEGKCVMANDPLPGGTGAGGSIWSRLPRQMKKLGLRQRVVLSVFAVDATSLRHWTSENSELHKRLVQHIASMKVVGLEPQLVVWQQGESDSRTGISVSDYKFGLQRLAETEGLRESKARVFLAKSTVCRSLPYEPIHIAVEAIVANNSKFGKGADTDSIGNSQWRSDGCHFSEPGLERAAELWAIALLRPVPE